MRNLPIAEEFHIKEIRLPTGDVYQVSDLLKTAVDSYQTTKKTYNLRARTKEGRVKVSGGGKFKNKYTKEDTLWMIEHTADQVAEKYQLTKNQAYYIKHYARRCWGL